MFDLDKSIAAWRRRYEHDRAFLPEDVRELERHVRDNVEALVKRGRSEEEAFLRVMREMGEHEEVRAAYRGVLWGKLRRRHTVIHHLSTEGAMLRNYFKTALRNLRRQKGYAALNITGLALGMACCLLIFQYVAFELSYDRFIPNAETIYRIDYSLIRGGSEEPPESLTWYALGPVLEQEVPEITRVARLFPTGADITHPSSDQKRTFRDERVFYADPEFVEMFSLPLVHGDPSHALTGSNTMLLSESMARKYFGEENPVGKVLEVHSWNIGPQVTVTGVFRDQPANAHLQFDFLFSVHDLLKDPWWDDDGWRANWFFTYAQLGGGAKAPVVEQKTSGVINRHVVIGLDGSQPEVRAQLRPLRDIHLESKIQYTSTDQRFLVLGDERTVHFLTLIALATLVIALINYGNLATARSITRAREVGVRKVVGAQRGQLIGQFLLESALTSGAALLLAVAVSWAVRLALNRFTDLALPGAAWLDGWFWAACLLAFGLGTLLAGLYPALVLSSFKPASVLKGRAGAFASRFRLRQALVVVQFAASITLLAGTAVVYGQLGFMRGMDTGLDLEQVLIVHHPLEVFRTNETAWDALKDDLRKIPSVRTTSGVSAMPGAPFSLSTPIWPVREGPSAAEEAHFAFVDDEFADVFGLEMASGRFFRGEAYDPEVHGGSDPIPVVINETAARLLGFATNEEAVGQRMGLLDIERFFILGVVKDFHWWSAHRPREAVVFYKSVQWQQAVKVEGADLPGTIAAIQAVYERRFPGSPFSYTFADEIFGEQYRKDQQFAELFTLFAGLAILIACLGLFGLAALAAQHRTKEIGIRKVLGASVASLVALLSSDFVKLILVAFVIAVPVAHYFIGRWLEGFAYRIEIGPGVFLLAGGMALAIALLTVSYQAVKAALADPVKSLRYE